ncbi:PhzF family isomerase [Clostridium merdae]|uniref:PhzF family isomerase n=1 Tax=Clostridium merdae TaxID=1958780 RepID=UPI000A26CD8D|nr:PhzF family isomerase [Clostridium merdae]
MSKKYKLYQVDAFTEHRFRGNPAGVVLNADGLAEQEMQEIARELNNSETAFVFSSDSKEYDVEIRFFTPVQEVPMCGHATIASHYVRSLEQNLPEGRLMQKIGAGILPVDIIRNGDSIEIAMTQGIFRLGMPLQANQIQELCAALRLSPEQLREGWPIQEASTGFGKIMVPIQSEETLDHLEPDWDALCRFSGKVGCNGFYVFAPAPKDADYKYCGRMFAPISGVREDPVTGNANGPLGGYLAHYGFLSPTDGVLQFSVLQGKAMGRPGIISVKVEMENNEPREIQISGKAVIVFSAQLEV